jgi:hypothetical protein
MTDGKLPKEIWSRDSKKIVQRKMAMALVTILEKNDCALCFVASQARRKYKRVSHGQIRRKGIHKMKENILVRWNEFNTM